MRSLLLVLVLGARLHAAEFPAPVNTEPAKGAPLPPAEAAAAVKTPPGFHVSMFAAEPDVQQPDRYRHRFAWRLWVAECYTYAESKTNFDTTLRDRVVILRTRIMMATSTSARSFGIKASGSPASSSASAVCG
jgi:hypothetical protein